MNVLILSAGTRNKIVRYFKEACPDGTVVAADAGNLAPAVYEADKYYLVPPVTDPGYMDAVLGICRKEKINGVLSLIDPELSLLAEHADCFQEVGTTVIGSSGALCEMSLNKMQMYAWLKDHGYNFLRFWRSSEEFYRALDSGEVFYPVMVKPLKGSASARISRVNDREMMDMLLAHEKDLMIQEYAGGQEIGADVYADLISGEVVSVFTKKKLRMRAGETDKSVSFKDPALFALIEKFVQEAGYRGPVDIDIFETDGRYVINEVNPRFGGGYPHAHECGCNHMEMIVNNLNGIVNQKRIGAYEDGVYMMKYNEVMIRR